MIKATPMQFISTGIMREDRKMLATTGGQCKCCGSIQYGVFGCKEEFSVSVVMLIDLVNIYYDKILSKGIFQLIKMQQLHLLLMQKRKLMHKILKRLLQEYQLVCNKTYDLR